MNESPSNETPSQEKTGEGELSLEEKARDSFDREEKKDGRDYNQ